MNGFARLSGAVLVSLLMSASVQAQTYLWGVAPGSGYVDGKTFVEAQHYCAENDAVLASKDELIQAHDRGFSLCAFGWLSGAIGGYVVTGMTGACGVDGWHGGIAYDPSKRLGVYCVGRTVPPGHRNIQLSSRNAGPTP